MAQSSELAKSKVVTTDGVVTATVLDRVSVDRLYVMLVNGALAARYANVADSTPLVSKEVRDQVVFPFTEP